MGYLKKYSKKEYNIDLSPFIADFPSIKVTTEFNYQYNYFSEHLNPRFLDPLYNELAFTIFVDANYSYNTVTGKAIIGILSFIGNTPVDWRAKRQASVKIATYRAELNALKLVVEDAICIRYYLRAMGVKISSLTKIYCDNKVVVTNTTTAGSILSKKFLVLVYHFCREYFSAKIVDIR